MTIFLDFETRCDLSLPKVGAHKYVAHPSFRPIVLAYAQYDAPPHCQDLTKSWYCPELADRWELTPVIAHNAEFDRLVWEWCVEHWDWWPFPLERWRCSMAQAEASGCPGGLGKACEAVGSPFQKNRDGKALMARFCMGPDFVDPNVDNKGWWCFLKYARDDVAAMRGLWHLTRPLTDQEWAEYHANQRVNDRGAPVDVAFAKAATAVAELARDDAGNEIAEVTGDANITPHAHLRKARWLYEALDGLPEVQAYAVKRRDKETGHAEAFTCDRQARAAVRDALEDPTYAEILDSAESEQRKDLIERLEADVPWHRACAAECFAVDDAANRKHLAIARDLKQKAETMPPQSQRVIAFIDAVDAGNSAAVHKYAAIGRRELNGRLHGMHTYFGANTGRFSSRAGVQTQNLIRDSLDNPEALIRLILSAPTPEGALQMLEEHHTTPKRPVNRLLGMLLRPTFLSKKGSHLVWGDLAQIEARVLPWLCDSEGAEARLDVFRSGRDVYLDAVGRIYGDDPNTLVKADPRRQIGKVAELALGFGGGVGAFAAMAKTYGVVIDRDTAQDVVTRWRAASGWAVHFWYLVKDAAESAMRNPLRPHTAGRLRYVMVPELMGGTLLAFLPSNHVIAYPEIRYERVYDEKKEEHRIELTCRKVKNGVAYRGKLWHGVFVENAVQGTASVLLREALIRLEALGFPTVLHTHDEVVGEVPIAEVAEAKATIIEELTRVPAWGEGLPLEATAESGERYAK